jgi:hypothetical protein
MPRTINSTSSKMGAAPSKAQRNDAPPSQNKNVLTRRVRAEVGFKEKRTPAGKTTPTQSVKSEKSQNSISSR